MLRPINARQSSHFLLSNQSLIHSLTYSIPIQPMSADESTINLAAAAAVDDSSSAAAASIDLAHLLLPLPRDRIELFLAELISRHPAEFPALLAMAHRPVDRHELIVATQNAINTELNSVMETAGELFPLIERAQDYLKANHVKNSIAILDIISGPLVEWAKDVSSDLDSEDEEFKSVEALFAALESAWQAAITAAEVEGREKSSEEQESVNSFVPIPSDQAFSALQISGFQEKLTKFKSALSSKFGPIFSDPIRAIKRKMGETANREENQNAKKKAKINQETAK